MRPLQSIQLKIIKICAQNGPNKLWKSCHCFKSVMERFRSMREHFRSVRNVLGESRLFQVRKNILRSFRNIQEHQESFRSVKNILGTSGMFYERHERFRSIRNGLKTSIIFFEQKIEISKDRLTSDHLQAWLNDQYSAKDEYQFELFLQNKHKMIMNRRSLYSFLVKR